MNIFLALILSIISLVLTIISEWKIVSNFSDLLLKYQEPGIFHTMVSNPIFTLSTSYILFFIASYNVYSYFINFSKERAGIDAIVPVILMLFAWKWMIVTTLPCM